MNATNPNHHIKRREALQRLIMLPMLSLGLNTLEYRGPAKAPVIKDLLTQCAMSIAACWELSKSSEHDDLVTAFHGVTTYLPTLQCVVKDATKDQQRKDAAGLAAQCLCLKAILGYHLEGFIQAKSYALNGTRALQSEKRFSEACQVYSMMECLWPHESRIRDPRDLMQHW